MELNTDQLQRRIENREAQLKEMAVQLANHLQLIEQQNERIAVLEEENVSLNRRLKRREEQLAQELHDKEILWEKLSKLETDNDQQVQKPKAAKSDDSLTNAYMDFYSKVQVGGKESNFKKLPDFNDFQVQPPETDHEPQSQLISNDVDITMELERMGLSKFTKSKK